MLTDRTPGFHHRTFPNDGSQRPSTGPQAALLPQCTKHRLTRSLPSGGGGDAGQGSSTVRSGATLCSWGWAAGSALTPASGSTRKAPSLSTGKARGHVCAGSPPTHHLVKRTHPPLATVAGGWDQTAPDQCSEHQKFPPRMKHTAQVRGHCHCHNAHNLRTKETRSPVGQEPTESHLEAAPKTPHNPQGRPRQTRRHHCTPDQAGPLGVEGHSCHSCCPFPHPAGPVKPESTGRAGLALRLVQQLPLGTITGRQVSAITQNLLPVNS